MADDLVERVARALFDARHKDLRDCWSWDDYWGDDQEPDREFYYRDATAAIAIVLEEVRPLVFGANHSEARYPKARAELAQGGDK